MTGRRMGWPLAVTVLALLGAVLPASPLRDAVTGGGVPGASLVRSALYSAIAPLSGTFDALSLLSVPQLIAFGCSLIVVYAAWRLLRRRRTATSGWCEFCAALRAFLLLALAVILTAVMPRPMARLAMDDPDAVVFDIHSHTNYSHDARATFTVADNRAWHRAAGFDVAYVTDHRCFDGAAEGMRGNPKRAGDGTVLLSGIELPAEQEHLLVLESPTVTVVPGLLEGWCVRAGKGTPPQGEPVIIETIPEQLGWMVQLRPGRQSGLTGIEISDGAPRGIAQAQRDRGLILHLAGALDLAPLAGSNNHGWGRTAVAWNVMRIQGWRDLAPDSVGRLIEVRLRAERGRAVTVVERRSPFAGGPVAVALTLPAMIVNLARTISWPERLAWIAWAWGAWGIAMIVRKRAA